MDREAGRLQSIGSISLQHHTEYFLYPKILWRRKWQSTPVFLPGESHGRRSLVGYSPWGRKESDTTERLHLTFTSVHCQTTQAWGIWVTSRLSSCLSILSNYRVSKWTPGLMTIDSQNDCGSVIYIKKAQFRQISSNIQTTLIFHNAIQKCN